MGSKAEQTSSMPTDFRLKIIHATRNGSLSGFGKEWRLRNHKRVADEAKYLMQSTAKKLLRRSAARMIKQQQRRKKYRRRRNGDNSSNASNDSINKSPFGNHRITDIGVPPGESRGAIPNERIRKMKKPLSSSYANYKNQNAKKKFHLSRTVPRIYYNSREFEEGERGHYDRRRRQNDGY